MMEFKEAIIDFLMTQDNAKTSSDGIQISFRCPFCGDSQTERHVNSFGVKVKTDVDEPMMYKCFRADCEANYDSSGKLDQDFLEFLGFQDYDIMQQLTDYNKHCRLIMSGKSSKFIGGVRKYFKNIMVDNELTRIKLAYLNNRLGTDLTLAGCVKLKIVMDAYKVFQTNDIDLKKKNRKWIKKLSDCGVGFISMNNDYITFRDVTPDRKTGKRYHNEPIYKGSKDKHKFYLMPGMKIDIMNHNEPTVLNITEGTISLLGAYFNTDIDRKYSNQLWASASGAGIINVIKYFIQMYGLINLKINIFSDTEIDIENYRYLLTLKPYLINFDINVHYNVKSDDFGHRKEDIEVATIPLK